MKKSVLFVCIENACRSQLAEGLFNNFYCEKLIAYSAGSKPSGMVNPKAIQVMKEIGIDISKQKSKGFNENKNIKFDYIITMGCGDVCPIYPAKKRIDWRIPDPKNKPIQFFRKVRDEIEIKVKNFLREENLCVTSNRK